jgi:hypothetical protein
LYFIVVRAPLIRTPRVKHSIKCEKGWRKYNNLFFYEAIYENFQESILRILFSPEKNHREKILWKNELWSTKKLYHPNKMFMSFSIKLDSNKNRKSSYVQCKRAKTWTRCDEIKNCCETKLFHFPSFFVFAFIGSAQCVSERRKILGDVENFEGRWK